MKHDAVNIFWRNWATYTKDAVAGGLIMAILLTGVSRSVSSPIKSVVGHPVVPLYLGIAGGVALS